MKQFCTKIKNSEDLSSIYVRAVDTYMIGSAEDSIFLADKLCTLLNDNVIAVYFLAECYYLQKDYVKVNFLFHKYNLLNYDENFLLLGLKSLKAINQLEQVTHNMITELKEPL